MIMVICDIYGTYYKLLPEISCNGWEADSGFTLNIPVQTEFCGTTNTLLLQPNAI